MITLHSQRPFQPVCIKNWMKGIEEEGFNLYIIIEKARNYSWTRC